MTIFSKGRLLAGVALMATTACIAAVVAPSSRAAYGSSAQYQVELSANNVGAAAGTGKGLWLWIELSTGGGGDFAGAGCKHNGSGGANGASPQSGDVSWSYDGNNLSIQLVLMLSSGPKTITITVPDSLGHYSGPTDSYLSPDPFGGDTQVTVAP